MEKVLMLGNEAIARGAYEAGVKVVASYPGTPSTEITEAISKYDNIYSEWSPNEKVAAEVAIGAAISGARSMTCMKHVGFNVATDPIFTVSYTGVNGGLVICVADDQGMHSSQNEQDSRHYARSAKIPMLEPSDSMECKDYTKLAFSLSEKYDTPVIIRLSTRVSHSQSIVSLGEVEDVPLKDYVKNPAKYVMMPAQARARHIEVEKRELVLQDLANSDELNTIEDNGSKIGVICGGIAYEYAKEALGDSVNYLKLAMVYPMPTTLIESFNEGLDKLYVIEELDPIIENHVKSLGIKAIGKEIFSLLGEYTANDIKAKILGESSVVAYKLDETIPVRPPVMCAGCPHRGTFYVLKKLGVVVSGDIGCYTLGAAAPLSAIDACVCMGYSISGAMGMGKARGKEFSKNLVSVIGDSTFMHSGVTGLIDVVYNKGINTILILDNSITGMTGHQPNPTTGYTIKGEKTHPVNLVKLCEAVGVKRISIVDPFDMENTEKVIKQELAADEPSVVIVQRPCALLKNVNYGAPYMINDKCKKCKMCTKIGCPAIVTNDDGSVVVDQTLCVGCGLCTKLCKFGALEKVGGDNE